MARLNLLAFGARRPHVFTVQDSVTDAGLDEMRGTIRLILTNPPFGDRKYDSMEGIMRAASVIPGVRGISPIDPAVAFFARCMELLSDGGVCGIILPDGILDGTVLRRLLVSHPTLSPSLVSVEANISLPTVTFSLAGTTAKTSALFFRKGGASRSHVFLARAQHVGYMKQAGALAPDPAGNELPSIVALAEKWLDSVPQQATHVISEEPLAALIVRDDLGTLDASRLDPQAIGAKDELRRTGSMQMRNLLRPVSRGRSAFGSSIPFISVLHIDELGAVNWQQAERYRPSTPGLRARAGDVIISLLNPRALRATVVPEMQEEVNCSSEFGVFQAYGDPYAVLALLHDPRVHAQLAPLGRGTSSSRRRIDPDDVLDILVPRAPDGWLAETGRKVQAALENYVASRLVLAEAYEVSPGSDSSSSS